MENEKTKIYGYMRVSTIHQHEDRQLAALLEAGVPQDKIFMDKQSGKNFERAQYQQLLSVLDGDSILFISSIDRLGRNYRELTEQWRLITKEKQTDIVVLDMPLLDTRNKQNLLGTFISDLVLSLLSYVAENEYHSIKQRQLDGIKAAKIKGVAFGRPQIPLPENFEEMHRLWRSGAISMKAAAKACGLNPKTFYSKAVRRE